MGNAVGPRTLGIDELDCASPDARLGMPIGKRGRRPFREGLGLIRGKNRAFPASSKGFPEFQATRLRQGWRRKNALHRKGHTAQCAARVIALHPFGAGQGWLAPWWEVGIAGALAQRIKNRGHASSRSATTRMTLSSRCNLSVQRISVGLPALRVERGDIGELFRRRLRRQPGREVEGRVGSPDRSPPNIDVSVTCASASAMCGQQAVCFVCGNID
jgi:hypothetical protein